MTRARGTAAAIALLLAALAAAGCGLGPGEDVGAVELTVTREFGAVPMVSESVEAKESDTVMRLLEGEAEITTRYGGRFVQSIDGVEGGEEGGRYFDWIFYVNGVESKVGAAEVPLHGGESIWWDFRDWTSALYVPAVVGAWPQPFRGGYEGRRHPTVVECDGGGEACGAVKAAIEGAGGTVAAKAGGAEDAIRVLVGPWARVGEDRVARLIGAGPGESGVFARFQGDGRPRLVGLDKTGAEARRFGAGAGLVAATRRYEAPPVWVVTGATPAGVRAAAELLDAEKLRDHYAVAVENGRETPLPVR